MPTMNVFQDDAFSLVSMAAAVERNPYVPQRLGQLGLFTPHPVRTETVAIEERDGTLRLIPTSPRGAPPQRRGQNKRRLRDFRTSRLYESDTITASELQGLRAFGTETEVETVQREVTRRLYGPEGLLNDIELTFENMRLGAIQGIVLDSDGSTIYNWFTEFGIAQPTEIDFDLTNGSPTPGALREKCTQVVRAILRGLKGMAAPTRIHALCGDNFWDALIKHSEVRATYLNQVAAAELRGGVAFGTLDFGGITFENYRGTDDNSTVAVGTNKVHFFPVGSPGVFKHVMAPGESFDLINTEGQAVYPMIVPDRDRNMYADVEVYAYPLFMCVRPDVLQRGKRAAAD